MGEPVSYVCGLDIETLAKAGTELNEDPKERLGAVETLREWISQQKHMTCNTETMWLLRTLRAAKFSQLKARKLITKFLTMKAAVPAWLQENDFTRPEVQLLFKTGCAFMLPGCLPDGSRVLYQNPGLVDTSSKVYDVHTLGIINFGLLSHALADENVQVNGIQVIFDGTGFGIKHQNFYSIEHSINFLKLMHGSFPMRVKAIHIYNHGPVVEAFVTLLKPLMPKKTKERLHLSGNSLEKIYKIIPQHMLPAEYMPDGEENQSAGTMKDIVDAQLKEMMSEPVKNKLFIENSARFKIDTSVMITDMPQESFRRLNID